MARMFSKSGIQVDRFLILAVAMAVGFFIAAWSVAAVYPLAADADARGRVEEVLSWKAGDSTPAQSRGPLHFYLLHLFVQSDNPENPKAALGDILCGAGFLIFYLLFIRRLFSEWIAVGSAIAICMHPTFIKYAVVPSGFSLFYFLLFAGFWAILPEFEKEAKLPLWKAIFAGGALSLSVFTRFEGGFFFLCIILLLVAYKRYRSVWIMAATAFGVLLFFSFATYFDPFSYLRGSTLFIGFQPITGRISLAEYFMYLLSSFGAIPLFFGIVGALIALKNSLIRPWAIIFLLFCGMIVFTFLKTRFQHDLDRYYLFLLFGFLPFFGFFIKTIMPDENKRRAGAVALMAFMICAFFYAGQTKETVNEASQIIQMTNIEELDEH